MPPLDDLFASELRVVNLGLASFAGPLEAAGVSVVTPAWRPPAGGDAAAGMMVARQLADAEVDGANTLAVNRLFATRPLLTGVVPASQALPALRDRVLLHAGPPVEWERMCGPMRGAITGAIVFEGWADDLERAEQLAAQGSIRFGPAHHESAVGPMAGIISPSMPVAVVEDGATGRRAFSTLNEGLGKVLRYGANDAEVLARLVWMRDRLGPALDAALRRLPEPLDLKTITAQALQMGDECHNRNVAATALMSRILAPALAREEGPAGAEVLEFMRDNNHFFLNFSMASCKLMAMSAEGVPGSTVVTAIARNGVEFGLRVSGMPERWFTAPAPIADGLFFPGYGPEDANPDIGDSAITETVGIGGFAMAAAPGIVGFVGGTPADAMRYTLEMGTITVAPNPEYQLPTLGFAGTPTGIDIRLVLDANVAPVINTGIAHRRAGIGQIGAGIVRAPMTCFLSALMALGGSR